MMILVTALALTATTANAQRFAYGPVGGNAPQARAAAVRGQPGDGMIWRLTQQLNLTSEQRAQVEQAASVYRPQLAEHWARMQAARLELDAVAGSADASDEAISAAADRVAEEMALGAVLRRDFHNALRACLTAQQQAELDLLIDQGFGPRRYGRAGPGPMRGKMRGSCRGLGW